MPLAPPSPTILALPGSCPLTFAAWPTCSLETGSRAAGEFQKVIDHPGIVESEVRGALAHLQLGRAQAMMGDQPAARKSYQDFLTLWKDADPDIPIYRQAKAEYAKLR